MCGALFYQSYDTLLACMSKQFLHAFKQQSSAVLGSAEKGCLTDGGALQGKLVTATIRQPGMIVVVVWITHAELFEPTN